MNDLKVRGLHAYYGSMHILHGVDLSMSEEPFVVVGRNGMGKSTLCKALMGLVRTQGQLSFASCDLETLASHERARLGIGYVPQGRRLFPSLTVDEHLHLLGKRSVWDADRVYGLFPRLAERRKHHSTSLSGGEQQMLAIGLALLSGPKLLVMDEPTEGLAPVVVETVIRALRELNAQGMRLLVVEQDLHVATSLAKSVSVMVNGRLETTVDSQLILADEELKARLLGLH